MHAKAQRREKHIEGRFLITHWNKQKLVTPLVDTTRRATRKQRRIRELYYITHIDNIPSMLKRGILSHRRMETEGIKYTPIYDKQIVSKRLEIKAPDGRDLWSFTNLFFNARNAMLYRVLCEKPVDDIAVLGIDSRRAMNRLGIFVTTGNAASALSEIVRPSQRVISRIIKETDKEWWKEADGSKRKIMAECLVPDEVPPHHIKSIYSANFNALDKIREGAKQYSLEYVRQPNMFFKPSKRVPLTQHLTVVEGDMFFSRLHTITISVNVVSIMGKGLASRAKYQFADAYVEYQDLCRKRQLRMGKPRLFKSESSFDYQLADEPATLKEANLETWFLFFPTKRHWRDRADIQGIENGLQWLCDTYRKNKIQSLAIPALGCGLGRLDWREVGPLLCKYLSALDIPVQIYLPMERKVPEELLSKDFLLRQ